MDRRSLAVRALLQLPRVAATDGHVPVGALRDEIARAADGLVADTEHVRREIGTPRSGLPVGDLVFGPVDREVARVVLTRLHYLHGDRPGAATFGLHDPSTGIPVIVCSVAALDWSAVGRALTRLSGVPRTGMLDVCRSYCLPEAPPRSLSRLIGDLLAHLRSERPGIQLLTTVVDLNLGFDGRGYRSSGMRPWLDVAPRPYLYDGDRYVSPRALRDLGETVAFRRLVRSDPRRWRTSTCPLLDSRVFARPVVPGAVLGRPPHPVRIER